MGACITVAPIQGPSYGPASGAVLAAADELGAADATPLAGGAELRAAGGLTAVGAGWGSLQPAKPEATPRIPRAHAPPSASIASEANRGNVRRRRNIGGEIRVSSNAVVG
ncbi:MAG: hypothetical protein ACRELB_00915, partial [Polyangiaceae bacterium]